MAQKAVSVASVSAHGNFHAGGVLLTVSGDANANATAGLEWRPAGGSFLAAQPLERIDATHFAGSLFGLARATSDEARVSLADPDGVAGSPVVAARVLFEDNKEGVLAVRVAFGLEEPSSKPEAFTDASGRSTAVPGLDNAGVNASTRAARA